MTVSSTTNRVEYTGNGATSTYSYTYRILDDDDLLVVVASNATPPVETTLTKTTDYTVTGVDETAGGTIVLVNASQAWLLGGFLRSGWSLVIRRVRPLKQETDIRNQGDFFPESHENEFDSQVMIDQQQQNEIDRTVKLPESVTDSDFDTTLPTDIAAVGNESRCLTTNATGDGFADAEDWPTTTAINTASASSIAAAASAAAAVVSAAAALASQSAAAASASAASTSASTATTQAGLAATAKTAAELAETNAETAETNAELAETNAEAAEVNAELAETNAAASAAAALVSQGAAATSATNAATSATNAATSATNAGTSETNAAASAVAAAASVASVMWQDVSFKVFGDSPITIGASDYGKLFAIDCSGGNVVVTLPAIAGLNLTLPWAVGIKKTDSSGNSVTINRASSDTIDGGTSKVLTVADSGAVFIPDTDPAPDEWTTAEFGASAGNLTVDRFNGDAVTVAFVLSVDPGSENNTWVFIDGVYQQKNTYSLSTTTLTFSTAPPSGTNNVEVITGTTLSIGTPGDGTVTNAKLAVSAIASQTNEASVASDDELLINDISESGGTLNKTTVANLLSAVAATQANQETATSLVTAVTPGRQQFHPSAVKAWTKFQGTGTPATVTSYNVSSITDGGVGAWQINFTTAFSSADFCAVTTGDNSIGSASTVIQTQAVGSVTVRGIRFTDNTNQDLTYAYVACFGDQ